MKTMRGASKRVRKKKMKSVKGKSIERKKKLIGVQRGE